MPISLASFAYPMVEGTARAELARRARPSACPAGTFLLSTCLRVEVAVIGDRPRLDEALERIFPATPEVAMGKVRSDLEAVTHLFRVAAGLESPILGEREILTQFRQALRDSEEQDLVDGTFDRLLEGAVAAGRQARELLPASPHDSLASVAAQIVGGLDHVAVVGSGLMATAAANALLSLAAPPSVTVLARRPERVTIEGVAVWPIERIAEALDEFPAVISATSAKHSLSGDPAVAASLTARTRPITLVDMAMPPDFPPLLNDGLEYYSIDDLARMADRRPRSQEADELVEALAIQAHHRLASHDQVGPVIGGLMGFADQVVEETVERFAGRLRHPDDRGVLHQVAHTVARTLLARPVEYLNQTRAPGETTETIAKAFGVEDE